MVEEEEVKRRVERFKELIKQGYTTTKAKRESKLHPRDYKRFKNEIWSDPDMAPFKPKTPEKEGEKPPPVVEAEKRLKELGVGLEGETQFEKDLADLERKRRAMLQAAQRVVTKYSPGALPGAPGSAPPGPQAPPAKEEKRDIFEEFEMAFKGFESTRSRIKETLDRMGFKVEDIYMKREEVEKLLEETKRRTAEEALDDKRITAVENIVRDAVREIVGMFSPAVKVWMDYALRAKGGETPSSSQKESSALVEESESRS